MVCRGDYRILTDDNSETGYLQGCLWGDGKVMGERRWDTESLIES